MLLFANNLISKKVLIPKFLLMVIVFSINLFFIEIQKTEAKLENLKNLTEEEILKGLNIEQKIGQLFLIGFEGKNLNSEIENLFKLIHPGGVILFRRNIEDEDQLKKLIKDLQELSLKETGLPLFIAVDQEGGLVRRIPWLKDNISQAKIKNKNQAYRLGFKRGNMLKALGINLNLAPVLDMTKKGDFLHSRSFQKKPEIAGELAKNLILGQKRAGIFTAVKHFPGYGGISFNPEAVKIPVLSSTPEISQFQKVIKSQPEFIMTSNAIYLNIDQELPFTLSSKGIQFLKKKLKGDYLIISDDLSREILKETFSLERSVILAKKAGVDILLITGRTPYHQDQFNAFNAIFKAIQEKEINEKQINDSVLKIIKLKQKITQLPN